ncbi:hypothetical protein D3C81_1565260 [compost metagenome]
MQGHAHEKGFGESLGRVVTHLPTRRDDATHAHVDQFAGEAGGQAIVSGGARLHFRQVAATEEHQVRHGLHAVDFGGCEQQAIGQHHPAAQDTVGTGLVENAMGRHHQHPIGPGKQLGKDVPGTGVARYPEGLVAGAFQDLGHRLAFLGRPFQFR